MKTFLLRSRYYMLFMWVLALAFLLFTAPELDFNFRMFFMLVGGGLIVSGAVLFLEIYRNSVRLRKSENHPFLISNLPLYTMIFMGILGNFQPEIQEPMVFFMVGIYLLVYLVGLAILQFVLKMKLELK